MIVKDFAGKTAYITGGSSGIGLACATGFAAKGANVVILARGHEQLSSAVGQIERSRISEGQVIGSISADVAERDSLTVALQGAVAKFGAPGILVNSAGISFPQKFEDVSYKKYDEIMKVNLYGTWNAVTALLPFIKEKRGYIINVSSVAGYIGVFGMTAYSASKFAVIGFSEALRSELKRFGVTVSVLCPPDVDTPMLERAEQIKPEETRAISAAASIMKADDVAKSVISAMSKGQLHILPGQGTVFTYNMSRWFPWLVEMVTDRQINRFSR